MAEFQLPKNSRLTNGKAWPKPVGANRLTEFKIYRYDPDSESNPRMDTYFVDRDDCGPMVLDAIIWIKGRIDSTPSAGWSTGPGDMNGTRHLAALLSLRTMPAVGWWLTSARRRFRCLKT